MMSRMKEHSSIFHLHNISRPRISIDCAPVCDMRHHKLNRQTHSRQNGRRWQRRMSRMSGRSPDRAARSIDGASFTPLHVAAALLPITTMRMRGRILGRWRRSHRPPTVSREHGAFAVEVALSRRRNSFKLALANAVFGGRGRAPVHDKVSMASGSGRFWDMLRACSRCGLNSGRDRGSCRN